jgi:ribosomal protein S18 acetylase RimI-like enzyme
MHLQNSLQIAGLNLAENAALRETCFALLLDADEARDHVEEYLARGELFVARLPLTEGNLENAPARVETASLAGSTRIVGVYVIMPTRPATIEVMNIAVAPDLQGRGIGRALLEHAIDTARKRGARTLEIGTGNSGVGQLALYQKAGFRIYAIDRDYFLRHYAEPIFENGIPCRDMVRLTMDL